MTVTSGGSSASSSRGPSRSAITTSASASNCLPLTVMRPGSPGPPPTRATPVSLRRWCRAVIVPDCSPAMTASRIAALCRGSPLSTPTLVSPAVPEAGVQAVAAAASSARTHHVRLASASAATAALTSGRSVQVMTSQAAAQSPLAYARRRQPILPRAASSSRAGVTPGETSSTSAPPASSRGTRRAATAPPPTTSTRLPRSRRPSRYASPCSSSRPVTAAGYRAPPPGSSPALGRQPPAVNPSPYSPSLGHQRRNLTQG